MNLYDFDNTIIKGDSSVKLIKYSFFRHPIMLIISSIKALKEVIKGSSLGSIKSELFSFVKKIPDLDSYINKFILKNKKHIKKFYLERQKENDVVIGLGAGTITNLAKELEAVKNEVVEVAH